MKLSWKPSWRFWRRLVQVACLGMFLWLFRRTEFDGFTEMPESVNLLFRLDPLVGASTMLGAREIILSLLIPGLILLALTFVLGRFFCGWICPLGTLLDGARWVVPSRFSRSRGTPSSSAENPTVPSTPGGGSHATARLADRTGGRSCRQAEPAAGWRRLRYFILFLILTGALVGLPIAGYFDPFSLLFRGIAFVVDPVFTLVVSAPFEWLLDWLYENGSDRVIDATESTYTFLKGNLLPVKSHVYLLGGVSFAILFGVFLLEGLGRRFWCRYLCPLGALLSIAARPSLLSRSPFKSCKGCQQCSEDCRMGAFDEEARMAPEACNLCMDCMSDCPHGMVKFEFRRPRIQPAVFEPSRRLFLGAAGSGLVLAAVARLDRSAAMAARPRPLRPPGSDDEGPFLDLCVRCGLCMKACITNGLHPSGLEAGWEAAFAPRLVPRIGYCEYNCTTCGEVCPTGAIPRLTEAEKHQAIIGKAHFDKNRCLPYAQGKPCIVCEEHCPISDKAIQLRDVETVDIEGNAVKLQEPYVQYDLCVGCGICENVCPLQGAAGIRVTHTKDAALTEEMAAGEETGDELPY